MQIFAEAYKQIMLANMKTVKTTAIYISHQLLSDAFPSFHASIDITKSIHTLEFTHIGTTMKGQMNVSHFR